MNTEILHIILAVCGTALLTFLIVERKYFLEKIKEYEAKELAIVKGDVTKVEDAVKAELAKVKHVTQSDLTEFEDKVLSDAGNVISQAKTDIKEELANQINGLISRLETLENKLNPIEPSTTSVDGVYDPNTTDQTQA